MPSPRSCGDATPAYLAPERLEGGQVSPATALLRAHQYTKPEPLPHVEGLPATVVPHRTPARSPRMTLGHEEHLGDVVAGYGTDVDLDVLRGWWSLRSLLAVRWLVEHGFDPSSPGCEIDVLRARM